MNYPKYWLLFLVLVVLTVLSITAPSHARDFPHQGLLAYWPFDGNALDITGHGFDLVLVGDPAPGFADGVSQNTKQSLELINDTAIPLQYALRAEEPTTFPFSENDLIPIDDPEFDFGDRDYTMSIWVNFLGDGLIHANTRDEQTIVEKFDNGGGPGWTLSALTGPPRLSQGGTFHWYAHNNSPNNMKPPGIENAFFSDRWYHLAIQRDGDMFRGYVDGVLYAENSAGTQTDAANPIYFGRRNPGDGRGFAFYGQIDEVGIWNRALSENEIFDLYNAGDGISGEWVDTPISKDFTWKVSSSGNWNERGNWIPAGGPPGNPTAENPANHTATFGDVIQSDSTVFADSDVSVRAIVFDNTNTYVVAGPGRVSLVQGTSLGMPTNSSILVAQGTHEFQLRVSLENNTDVTVSDGATLEFNNRVYLNNHTLAKIGDGTLAINNNVLTGGGTFHCAEGTCSGTGTISGNLNNDGGTISPGNGSAVNGVPEPASFVLAMIGLVTSLTLLRRKR